MVSGLRGAFLAVLVCNFENIRTQIKLESEPSLLFTHYIGQQRFTMSPSEKSDTNSSFEAQGTEVAAQTTLNFSIGSDQTGQLVSRMFSILQRRLLGKSRQNLTRLTLRLL